MKPNSILSGKYTNLRDVQWFASLDDMKGTSPSELAKRLDTLLNNVPSESILDYIHTDLANYGLPREMMAYLVSLASWSHNDIGGQIFIVRDFEISDDFEEMVEAMIRVRDASADVDDQDDSHEDDDWENFDTGKVIN